MPVLNELSFDTVRFGPPVFIADNQGKLLRRIDAEAASNPKTLRYAIGGS